jgi:endoribonuclease Dicer
LHSQIATARDLTLLQKAVTKPDEKVLSYRISQTTSSPSEFYHELKTRFGNVKFLDTLFDNASKIRAHLGTWCADRYWGFVLAENRFKKMESRVEKSSASNLDSDLEVAQIRKAMDMIANHDFGNPKSDLSDLSHKVQQLCAYLGAHYERESDYRCIVFVEQRSTAYLLHQVLLAVGGLHLRPGLLIGAGNGRGDDMQSTFRNQVVTLIKFRKGELNCLFATSVAEEGLDIPDCNLVVRFDLCKTMIQYVQSRGRARHKNSKFLHMRELDNWDHETRVAEIRGAEDIMRRYCGHLPADRLLEGDDMNTVFSQDMIGLYPTHVIASTGAKITFGSALQILSHFVDSLPRDGEDALQLIYVTLKEGGRFVCEVIIPDPSPVRSARGNLMTQKSLAKRSAAFEACKELVARGHLDANLVPIYTKKLPAMRNAALALSSKQSGMYDLRIKPRIWDAGRDAVPSTIYFTHLDVSHGLDRPHRPLLLITRTPMPDFPKFPLFLNNARRTDVKSTSFTNACVVTEAELSKLNSFTLRIFKDIYNKTYEFDLKNMPYWLAPCTESAELEDAQANPFELIDWTITDYVSENEKGFRWSHDMPDADLVNKFFIDQWDGGRRFYSLRIAPEYTPSSPIPEGCATSKRQVDILDYTVSLWTKTRENKKRSWSSNQPVLEAEKVLHRRNMLAEPTTKEDQEVSKTRSFVCPEPLIISAVRICTINLIATLTKRVATNLHRGHVLCFSGNNSSHR